MIRSDLSSTAPCIKSGGAWTSPCLSLFNRDRSVLLRNVLCRIKDEEHDQPATWLRFYYVLLYGRSLATVSKMSRVKSSELVRERVVARYVRLAALSPLSFVLTPHTDTKVQSEILSYLTQMSTCSTARPCWPGLLASSPQNLQKIPPSQPSHSWQPSALMLPAV